jgi:hypothetical protein
VTLFTVPLEGKVVEPPLVVSRNKVAEATLAVCRPRESMTSCEALVVSTS